MGIFRGRLAGEFTEGQLQGSINRRLDLENSAMQQQALAEKMMQRENEMRSQKGLPSLPSDLSAQDWMKSQKKGPTVLGTVGKIASFPLTNPIGQMGLFMGAPYVIDAMTPKADPIAQMQAMSFGPQASEAQKQAFYQQQVMQMGGLAR